MFVIESLAHTLPLPCLSPPSPLPSPLSPPFPLLRMFSKWSTILAENWVISIPVSPSWSRVLLYYIILFLNCRDFLKFLFTPKHKQKSHLPVWTTINSWLPTRQPTSALPTGQRITSSQLVASVTSSTTNQMILYVDSCSRCSRGTGIQSTLFLFSKWEWKII